MDSLLSVTDAAREAPLRIALDIHGRQISYSNLEREVRSIAVQELSGPLALVAHRTLPPLVALLACLKSQIPVLLLSPRLPISERARVCARARACAIFDDSGLYKLTPSQKCQLVPGDQFLVPTSGSSGEPKIVVLTRSNIVASAQASADRIPLTRDSRWALTLPFHHVGGLSILIRSLIARACVVVTEGDLSQPDTAPQIARLGVTHISWVPTQLARALEANVGCPPALRTVLIGGAAAPPELRARARSAGWPAVFSYGLTEAGSQVCTQEYGADTAPGRERDVGRPLPGVEVALDGKGRISMRGPNLMRCYLGGAPLAPSDWFVSNDFGRWDDDRLVVEGRGDDIIITGGENVSATRIEEALRSTPFVTDAIVCGVFDNVWGQLVAALISGDGGDVGRVRAALSSKLEPYAVPKEFLWCDTIPRLESDKPDRKAALETIARMLTSKKARAVPKKVPGEEPPPDEAGHG